MGVSCYVGDGLVPSPFCVIWVMRGAVVVSFYVWEEIAGSHPVTYCWLSLFTSGEEVVQLVSRVLCAGDGCGICGGLLRGGEAVWWNVRPRAGIFGRLWVGCLVGVGVWCWVFDTPVVVLCLLGFGGVWCGVGLRGGGLWCRFFFCCRSRPAGFAWWGLWVCGGGLRTQ